MYRDFILHNAGAEKIDHMYDCVQKQAEGEGREGLCLSCTVAGRACADTSGPPLVHLLISGTPCNPFSKQNSRKRWSTGHVKGHASYGLTMQTLLGLYKKYAPLIGVMEQVCGFDMAYDSATSETPYARPAESVGAVS